MRSSLQLNYADPAGVGNEVTATENRTGRNQFDLKRPALILDALALTAPATTDNHRFFIERLNGMQTDLFVWTQILPANANTVKPFLPKGIGLGIIQWKMIEIAAAAAGVNVLYTFDKPLIG